MSRIDTLLPTTIRPLLWWLLIPLLGSLVALVLGLSEFSRGAGNTLFTDTAGRLRMLSQQILLEADAVVHEGNLARQARLTGHILQVDELLHALGHQGVVLGERLPPLPDDSRDELGLVKAAWISTRSAARVIADPASTSTAREAAYPLLAESALPMLESANQLVEEYSRWAREAQNRLYIDFLALVAFTTLALAAAIGITLRHLGQRQRMESDLRENSRFIESVLDVAGALVIVLDRDGRILRFNKACEITSGYSFTEAHRRHVWDFLLPPEAMEPVKAAFAQLAAGDYPGSVENDWLTRHGQRRRIAWSSTVLTEADGRVSHVIGVGIDITERRAAEAALSASEKRFRALVETTSDWIWEVDAQGRYVYASPRVRDILGYEPEEMLGHSPFDFMPPEEAARVRPVFFELAARKSGFELLENVNIHKDGHLVTLETSGVPILDAHGNPKGFRGVDRDVSERKDAELALRRHSDELERLHQEQADEEALAGRIMDRITHRFGPSDPRIQSWLQASGKFDGDAFAFWRTNDGRLYLMLADATGHGLPAAVSLLPAITVFYGMARRRFPLQEIVTEMNQQMRDNLPPGQFLAAILCVYHEAEQCLEWWVGGMPPILALNAAGEVEAELGMKQLPLGVVDFSADDTRPGIHAGSNTQRYLLYSDGLVDALNPCEVAFGETCLREALARRPDAPVDVLREAVTEHLHGQHAHDDISVVCIRVD